MRHLKINIKILFIKAQQPPDIRRRLLCPFYEMICYSGEADV
jgi:hypothetical protein